MALIVAVDDEMDVLAALGRALEREEWKVQLVNHSLEAYAVIEEKMPDLVILDILMPGIDGIQICRKLRENARFAAIPILFLTAKGRTDDIVAGLDAGADAYIIKPFHLAELRARVNALLRRNIRDLKEDAILIVDKLQLDSRTHQVSYSGKLVQLTTTEHRLLRYMMLNLDKPLPPMHLLEEVWDYPPNTGDPDLVRAHIRNLRAKLKKSLGRRFIETVHGVGYVIQAEFS
ncbi:MAG: response regulator transcription factor [Phototrophicaceae bacterium]|jgi:DNA-binding response OmpR family regulator